MRFSRKQRRRPKPFSRWIDDYRGSELNFCKDISDVEGAPPPPPWLDELRVLCRSHGCVLAFDPDRHWQESLYFPAGLMMDLALIWAGGMGRPNYCCTAVLHEFGHHLLSSRKEASLDYVKREAAAWKLAERIALERRLPFVSRLKRQALYSYRLNRLLEETAGSKARTSQTLSKRLAMAASRRSEAISVPKQASKAGPRSSLRNKRLIKKATTRAERHKPHDEDQ